MRPKRKAAGYLRAAMIAVAVFLPALSLIPLGSLWLWEKGYLFYWVVAALGLSVSSFLIEMWLVRGAKNPAREAALSPSDEAWTPREAAAWTAVLALTAEADPEQLIDRDSIVNLGLRTIETVARSIHPQDQDPLWKFTVPEALALVERVARDLRPFVADNIPLGDQLTVAQVIKIYRWRSVIDVANQAYDLWRIIRLVNPAAAITTEARERITKKLYDGVRGELAGRLTQGFVKEVGRAAIDLYGGRLRISGESLAGHVSAATTRDLASPAIAEPLRLLVAGQISAGKSSLINAMSREVLAAVDVLPATKGFTAYQLKCEALPAVLLIDSPGIAVDADAIAQLSEEAGACDLVIWVVAANRADRQLDHASLGSIRSYFSIRTDRRRPPILAVVTHIDLLRPYQEWAPPYDIATPSSAKAGSIRAALQQVSRDLDVPINCLIPVVLGGNHPVYNIDLVWAKISELLPEARRAQLVRRLRGASGWTWGKLWSQAVNAGRVATRTLTKP